MANANNFLKLFFLFSFLLFLLIFSSLTYAIKISTFDNKQFYDEKNFVVRLEVNSQNLVVAGMVADFSKIDENACNGLVRFINTSKNIWRASCDISKFVNKTGKYNVSIILSDNNGSVVNRTNYEITLGKPSKELTIEKGFKPWPIAIALIIVAIIIFLPIYTKKPPEKKPVTHYER